MVSLLVLIEIWNSEPNDTVCDVNYTFKDSDTKQFNLLAGNINLYQLYKMYQTARTTKDNLDNSGQQRSHSDSTSNLTTLRPRSQT